MLKTIAALMILSIFLIGLVACAFKPITDADHAQAAASSDMISFEVSVGLDPHAHDTTAFPFYEDGEFLQKAYAMGYTDRLLQTLWEGGYTKQSLLAPQQDFLYDTSPDGKNILYLGSNMGSVTLSLEPLCMKNIDTGEITVIDTDGPMADTNKFFASNDRVGVFGSNGGWLYNLQGEKLLSIVIDPKALGYFLYMPVYDPSSSRMWGLGTAYKTAISIDEGNDRPGAEKFALIELGLDGKVISAADTDIPLEVNRYNQILYPDGAYLRDGCVWISMTTLDGGYTFYRTAIGSPSMIEAVDSSVFRAVFPEYSRKG